MTGKNGDRQFVDTNVLVYAHDTSAGEKHARAKALVAELWQSGNGCLSVQVLQEFYVTVHRQHLREEQLADSDGTHYSLPQPHASPGE